MSMWRRITKTLHERGPMTTAELLDALTAGGQELDAALREARRLGVVERIAPAEYAVTEMGRAYSENIVQLKVLRPGGGAWAATWMQPLPRYAA